MRPPGGDEVNGASHDPGRFSGHRQSIRCKITCFVDGGVEPIGLIRMQSSDRGG